MANRLKLPTKQEIALSLHTLSPQGRRLVVIFAILLAISLLGLGWSINSYFSAIVPASGGSLREGVIGTPLFINPVLAASDTDRDLTTLIYSGLMRVTGEGKLVPDLAQSYEVSADHLIYTFVLKDDLEWQDGKPVTASDIEFTIEKIQDPLIKSPRRASWEGIRVEVVDEKTIRFVLKKPYASFLETATTGILPKHVWKNFTPETFSLNQWNTESIGSGPYKIKRIQENKETGIPEYYDLVPFKHFALGMPKIEHLRLRFYPNETALIEGYLRREIDSLSAVSAEQASKLELAGARILKSPLPRVFGIFFNHNKAPIFLNKEVRAALDAALDRKSIIESTLYGYGTPIDGPLPTSTPRLSEEEVASSTNRLAEARAILEQGGWTWNESSKLWEKKTKNDVQTLTFSIATSDVPELKRSAELVKDTWEALGAKVELKVYEIGDLNKDVIRPREYEALFFGQVLGRTPDLYSFWHSSQRPDPGNNIALYANVSVDKLLDKLRGAGNRDEATETYQEIETAIRNDVPATFVYAPDFLYLMPPRVKGVDFRAINLPSDRFLSVYDWHINTDKVWRVFIENNN